jgi:hypothetical protein
MNDATTATKGIMWEGIMWAFKNMSLAIRHPRNQATAPEHMQPTKQHPQL